MKKWGTLIKLYVCSFIMKGLGPDKTHRKLKYYKLKMYLLHLTFQTS
jgi:hypothetical protein